MATNLNLSNVSVNAEANALAPLCNNGYIRIYSGTQPATADTALSGNNLLAELRFASTAFGSASLGVLTANSIGSVTASGSGTATFFRCFESDGTTVLFDGTVGTSGCDLNLSTTTISSGLNVSITSFTYTVTK